MGSDDVYGVWRIDDTDNSFSTQPFRIKYARQDVLLSIMISFNLPVDRYEVVYPSLTLSLSARFLAFGIYYCYHVLPNYMALYLQGPPTSAVILKFELMYAAALKKG